MRDENWPDGLALNGLFHGCDRGECGWSDDEYAEAPDAHDAGSPPPDSPFCAVCGLLPCAHGVVVV